MSYRQPKKEGKKLCKYSSSSSLTHCQILVKVNEVLAEPTPDRARVIDSPKGAQPKNNYKPHKSDFGTKNALQMANLNNHPATVQQYVTPTAH